MIRLITKDLKANFISLVLLEQGQNLIVSKYIFVPESMMPGKTENFGSSKVITAEEPTYFIVMNLHLDHITIESLLYARTQCTITPHIGWAERDEDISEKLAAKYSPNAFSSSRFGLQRIILLPGEECYVHTRKKNEGWILATNVIMELKNRL